MILINEYFNQIYLINLPRRPDKLTKVLWQLNRYHIKVRLIEAFDGRHPSIYFKQKVIPPGAYGYVLTWIRILNHAITNKYKRILILDDDVILHHNFDQLFSSWVGALSSDWKVILLGATQHTTRPNLIAQDLGSDEMGDAIRSYHPKVVDGSFATGISQKVFHEILDLLSTHDQIVDSHVLRRIYQRYPYACFVAYPNLMIADVTSSDIQSSRNQADLASKVGWILSDYHFSSKLPLVSIIMSCYQAESTIERSLQSILDQTYRPLELIITDDGSTDGTMKVISQVLEKWSYHPKSKDLRIVLHRHAKNQGAYVSRNRGLRSAQGDFITFQDADDISLNHRIETQINMTLSKNVEFTTCLILRTHLNVIPYDPVELENQIIKSRIHPNKYCCRSKVGLVTTFLRRSLVERLGYYQELKWGADAEYLQRLFPKLDPNYRIMNYLNDTEYIPGLYYRINEILYLSYEMTAQNLTMQRMGSEAGQRMGSEAGQRMGSEAGQRIGE
jgi:GR25 family glycosyltransferase involved in LPS biosynthesis